MKIADVSHVAEHEMAPIEGSFAYGDAVADKAAEVYVRSLSESTIWGWCTVKTTAAYGGFVGTTFLGACSYESADAFTIDEGETQAHEACAALLDSIMHAVERGKSAAGLLSELRRL